MKPMKLAAVTAKRLRPWADTSKADPHHPLLLDVNRVDEADARRVALHDDRAGAGAVAEETDAAHQATVGDAGGGEDDALAGGELLRGVDAVRIGDAHRAAA